MQIGLRQRLVFLVFSGVFVTMSLIGAYRYAMERRDILSGARSHAGQSGRLMAGIAAPLLMTADYGALHYMAQNFMNTADAQEIVIMDDSGRELVRAARPDLAEERISLPAFPIASGETRFGELRIAVYPADMGIRLRGYAVSAFAELVLVFIILAALLSFSVSHSITGPLEDLGAALKRVIDRKDFTVRAADQRGDEIGSLASGVNYLIEHLERFVREMSAIAARINELSPEIASAARGIRKDSEAEAGTIATVVSSVGHISSTIHAVTESAENLSLSAEETSSAILEMNASNQEVARHTAELASSVEEVTTSVMEMIASIREVAEHVETVSAAAEETSASAIEIEATVREVEGAAKEAARLSQQVSSEARNIGTHSIEETANAMRRIKDSVTAYSGLVTKLGKRSEEIGKILGVIVEVTERTNLLALNASILAAQAGEHGKGFAVVADEIKALADRTAGSTQDISRLIGTVQKETREAVVAMTESLVAVDEGVSRSEEAGTALIKIVASSGKSAETANMIERAMTEQSRGIRQVSDAIANVKQMMNQIAAATQAQTDGTEMILKASEEMREIAGQVNTAMMEQARGGKQIAEAAENVTSRAAAIATSSREQGRMGSQILEAVERVQDLPRGNIKRMEGMEQSIGTLEEQARLLKQELVTIAVERTEPT